MQIALVPTCKAEYIYPPYPYRQSLGTYALSRCPLHTPTHPYHSAYHHYHHHHYHRSSSSSSSSASASADERSGRQCDTSLQVQIQSYAHRLGKREQREQREREQREREKECVPMRLCVSLKSLRLPRPCQVFHIPELATTSDPRSIWLYTLLSILRGCSDITLSVPYKIMADCIRATLLA